MSAAPSGRYYPPYQRHDGGRVGKERKIGHQHEIEGAVAHPHIAPFRERRKEDRSIVRTRRRFGHARGIGVVNVDQARAPQGQLFRQTQRGAAEDSRASAVRELFTVHAHDERGVRGVRSEGGSWEDKVTRLVECASVKERRA